MSLDGHLYALSGMVVQVLGLVEERVHASLGGFSRGKPDHPASIINKFVFRGVLQAFRRDVRAIEDHPWPFLCVNVREGEAACSPTFRAASVDRENPIGCVVALHGDYSSSLMMVGFGNSRGSISSKAGSIISGMVFSSCVALKGLFIGQH